MHHALAYAMGARLAGRPGAVAGQIVFAIACACSYRAALAPTTEGEHMSLTEARFHDLVDTTQQNLEDLFDDSGLDVDMENSGGVLTLRFEGGSQLIFSRQPALRQLWLAARSGGFHFDYDAESGKWMCDSTDELLNEMLVRIVFEQAGEKLDFDEI